MTGVLDCVGFSSKAALNVNRINGGQSVFDGLRYIHNCLQFLTALGRAVVKPSSGASRRMISMVLLWMLVRVVEDGMSLPCLTPDSKNRHYSELYK